MKSTPTTWDETLVPDAGMDSYITVARRKGNNWYVGSLNNSTPRTIKIPLNFLPEGQYTAQRYSDASNAKQHPNHLVKQTIRVTNTDLLTIDLAAGGGGEL